MKTVSMSGSLRENVGKKDAKILRKKGLIPCVIYGGKKQIHFSIEEKQFKPLIFSPEAAFIELKIGKDTFSAVLQEIQYHPVTDMIIHADFYEFTNDMEIPLYIPIITEGSAPGVLKGGRLIIKYRRVKVKALPENMPDNILINISELEINDNVKVRDIETENFDILLPEGNVIVGVSVTRVAVEEEEEGEGEGEEGAEGEEGEEGAEGKDGTEGKEGKDDSDKKE